MYNILIIGASGQLGSELQAIAGQYDFANHFLKSVTSKLKLNQY